MPVVTGLALGLGIAGAVGAAASTAIGYHAAGQAAKAQTQGAQNAIDWYKNSQTQAQAYNADQLKQTEQQFQPYQTAGNTALSTLNTDFKNGTFDPYGKTFQAPTGVDEQNDPGFQFRLQQGQQALERSAAARGGLLSGGTAKSLDAYSQGQASNEYGNVYNRALSTFGTNYDVFRNNQNDTYNRLAGVAGIGLNATNALGNFRQNASGLNSNLATNFSQGIGNAYLNKGAAQASGYINQANQITSGISQIPSLISGFQK